MSDKTNISWSDATWNPVTGCSKVSPGCDHCYAETLTAGRLRESPRYKGLTDAQGHWTGEVRCHPELLEQPLRWNKPRRIFVCSMSDLFHDKVPWEFTERVFQVMANCPQHTFQVLTKRPGMMAEFAVYLRRKASLGVWPDNVWAGTSLEMERDGKKRLTGRLDCLARVPARVRFVSCEPLLGPLDLTGWLEDDQMAFNRFSHLFSMPRVKADPRPGVLSWVIAGGESGPGFRPIDLDWLEELAHQCTRAGVPLWVKQDSGTRPGQQGRIPDRLWSRKEMPALDAPA